MRGWRSARRWGILTGELSVAGFCLSLHLEVGAEATGKPEAHGFPHHRSS